MGDTLDVKVQASVCGDWIDICHFTQHTLNLGANIYLCRLAKATAVTPLKYAVLAAGASRSLFSDIDSYRVHTTLVDAGAGVDVTLTVKAYWD